MHNFLYFFSLFLEKKNILTLLYFSNIYINNIQIK